MTYTSKFWEKVHNCQHEFYDDYYGYINCDMAYLGSNASESHCKKCGVYISECGCGCSNGMSGWSAERRRKFNQKKMRVLKKKWREKEVENEFIT